MMRAFALCASFCVGELLLQVVCLFSVRIRCALEPWQGPSVGQSYTIPDAQVGHRGNPAVANHDEAGFRNRGVPTEADVVAIGDSQTYGFTVRREQAWPQQLARRTGKRVYNMGMGGWGPVRYRACLDRALAMRPKLIIVGLYFGNDLVDAYHAAYQLAVGNDLQDPARRDELGELEARDPLWRRINRMCDATLQPPGSSPDPAPADEGDRPERATQTAQVPTHSVRVVLSEHSRLYGLLRLARRAVTSNVTWQEWKAWAHARPEFLTVLDASNVRTILTAAYRGLAVDVDDPRVAEGLEVSMRAIADMAERCRTNECKLLVVLIPTKESALESFVETPQVHPGYTELLHNEGRARQRVIEALSAQGVDFVDALPALAQCPGDTDQNPYHETSDGHPSAMGHACLARLVARHALFPE